MSEEYFVLVMEEYFGVFDVGASGYPEKFLKNMKCVCVIRGNREVDDYLLKHPNVGRNVLNKCEFQEGLSPPGFFKRWFYFLKNLV